MTMYVFATSPNGEKMTLKRLEESPLGILYEGPNATLLVVTLAHQPTDSVLTTETGLFVPTHAEISATAVNAESHQVLEPSLGAEMILEHLRPLTGRLGYVGIEWATNPNMRFEDEQIILAARDALRAEFCPSGSTSDYPSGQYL